MLRHIQPTSHHLLATAHQNHCQSRPFAEHDRQESRRKFKISFIASSSSHVDRTSTNACQNDCRHPSASIHAPFASVRTLHVLKSSVQIRKNFHRVSLASFSPCQRQCAPKSCFSTSTDKSHHRQCKVHVHSGVVSARLLLCVGLQKTVRVIEAANRISSECNRHCHFHYNRLFCHLRRLRFVQPFQHDATCNESTNLCSSMPPTSSQRQSPPFFQKCKNPRHRPERNATSANQ